MNKTKQNENFFNKLKKYSIYNITEYIPKYFLITIKKKLNNKNLQKKFNEFLRWDVIPYKCLFEIQPSNDLTDSIVSFDLSLCNNFISILNNKHELFICELNFGYANKDKGLNTIIMTKIELNRIPKSLTYSPCGNFLVVSFQFSGIEIYDVKNEILITEIKDTFVIISTFNKRGNLLLTLGSSKSLLNIKTR